MKAKSVNNNLVGRKVLIDWPVRWRGADPTNSEMLKAEAKAKEQNFGETGEIVAYNPGEPSGKELTICLDSSKEIVHLYDGAVTITSVAPREEDHKEITDLLRRLIGAVERNSTHG
jgi:hypothetical protein